MYALLDAEFLMMQELRAMTNLRLTIYASIGGHAEYVDVHNTRYIQELDFHKDGTGVEIIGKHQQANGNSTREEYHFKWNWGSSHKTISVQYDEGNAVFMDNVFIADRKFSYKMMGEEYFFDGFNKSYN